MWVITYKQPGAPSVLNLEKREIPPPGAHDVLIKVSAASINRPDVLQRRGLYPAPRGVVQDIPGLDISGVIEAIGNEVQRWHVGQEVCALVPGGGYAEYVIAHEGSCLPIPRGISLEDAASLPEVLFTVWHNVFQRGNLKKGEIILIYGGSGGIGSMAIQLTSLFGAHAYSVASTPEKIDFCLELGAEKVINYRKQELLEEFGSSSMNIILDSLGGKYLDINLRMLKPEGRLLYINAMQGTTPALNILRLMTKRLHITGSTLRSRSYSFKKSLAMDIYKNAYPLLEHEQFQTFVKSRFPLSQAAEAHELMESRDFMGKILLIP